MVQAKKKTVKKAAKKKVVKKAAKKKVVKKKAAKKKTVKKKATKKKVVKKAALAKRRKKTPKKRAKKRGKKRSMRRKDEVAPEFVTQEALPKKRRKKRAKKRSMRRKDEVAPESVTQEALPKKRRKKRAKKRSMRRKDEEREENPGGLSAPHAPTGRQVGKIHKARAKKGKKRPKPVAERGGRVSKGARGACVAGSLSRKDGRRPSPKKQCGVTKKEGLHEFSVLGNRGQGRDANPEYGGRVRRENPDQLAHISTAALKSRLLK